MRKARRVSKQKRQQGVRWWKAIPWWLVGVVSAVVAVLAFLLVSLPGSSHEKVVEVPTPSPWDARRVGDLQVSTQSVDLGHVPLGMKAVSTFRLRNVGEDPVTVTIANENVKTLEGCCPPYLAAGPAASGNTYVLDNMPEAVAREPATPAIAPGEEIFLRVELVMHEGMGGPHLFLITIPAAGADMTAQPAVELRIRGHFG